ncbi:MAG: cell division protein ZapA [Caulobacteraceae bacterium]
MAQLTIHVNAKPYVVGCEDGEEAHLRALAAVVDAKAREAAPEGGQLAETRVLLLAALILADELGEAQARLAAAEGQGAAFHAERRGAEARAVAAIEAAARKIEAMATRSTPTQA